MFSDKGFGMHLGEARFKDFARHDVLTFGTPSAHLIALSA